MQISNFQLEMKIKPMMDHTESTLDALGVFDSLPEDDPFTLFS